MFLAIQALPPPNPKNPIRVMCRRNVLVQDLRKAVSQMSDAVTAVLHCGYSHDLLKQDVGDPLDNACALEQLLHAFLEDKELWADAIGVLDDELEREIRYFSSGLEDSEPQGEG